MGVWRTQLEGMARQTDPSSGPPATAPGELTIAEIRRRYASAYPPAPWIYWTDMLASASVGWTAFVFGAERSLGSAVQVLATVVAVFALLRAALFVHELAHLKPGLLPLFEPAWNLLVGLPLMLPSLMYVGSHGDHHRRTLFGTAGDPEYAPIARWGRLRIAAFVLTGLAVPPMLAIRWGVLGPLSYVIKPLRRPVVEQMSTLIINTDYRRPMPRQRQAVKWAFQEAGAAIVVWVVISGVAAGWLPIRWLLEWYLVGAGALTVNQVRTLAAHKYNNDGRQLDIVGELLDSINMRARSPENVLAAPVGLRYHALHHLLPNAPYHTLGALHRRLLREVPAGSPYRRAEAYGIVTAVWDLLGPRRRSA